MKTLRDGLRVPDEVVADARIVQDRYGRVLLFKTEADPGVVGVCPNCGGVPGHGGFWLPAGQQMRPYLFGPGVELRHKLQFYPCPDCSQTPDMQYRREQLRLACGLVEDEQLALTMDSVWWGRIPERLGFERQFREAVSQLTTGKPMGWYTLVGPFGCGKSTFLAVMTNALVTCNVAARYVVGESIVQEMKAAISAREQRYQNAADESVEEVWARYAQVPVLLFDQLDWLEEATEWAQAQIRTLLNQRYEHRYSQATVLAVNLKWWQDGASRILGPIADRMQEGRVILTTVEGVREFAGQLERGELAGYIAPGAVQ